MHERQFSKIHNSGTLTRMRLTNTLYNVWSYHVIITTHNFQKCFMEDLSTPSCCLFLFCFCQAEPISIISLAVCWMPEVLQVNLLPRRSLEEVICSSSLPPLIEIWVMAHERETCCITPEQKVSSPVFSWATHLLIFLYPQWCCDQHRPGCTCVWKLRSFRTRRYFPQTITAIGSLYLYPHFLSRTPTGKEAH